MASVLTLSARPLESKVEVIELPLLTYGIVYYLSDSDRFELAKRRRK